MVKIGENTLDFENQNKKSDNLSIDQTLVDNSNSFENFGNIVIPGNVDEIFKSFEHQKTEKISDKFSSEQDIENLMPEHNNYLLDQTRLSRLTDQVEEVQVNNYDDLLSSAMSPEHITHFVQDNTGLGVSPRRKKRQGNPYLGKPHNQYSLERSLSHIVLSSDNLSEHKQSSQTNNFLVENNLPANANDKNHLKNYFTGINLGFDAVPLEEILNIPQAQTFEQTKHTEDFSDFSQAIFNCQMDQGIANTAKNAKEGLNALNSHNQNTPEYLKNFPRTEIITQNFFEYYEKPEQTKNLIMWDHICEPDDSLLVNYGEQSQEQDLWEDFDLENDLIDISLIFDENYSIEVVQESNLSTIYIKSANEKFVRNLSINNQNISNDFIYSMLDKITAQKESSPLSMGKSFGIFALDSKEKWFGSDQKLPENKKVITFTKKKKSA